jgi:molecular chaperone GrpE (heat shock protein)
VNGDEVAAVPDVRERVEQLHDLFNRRLKDDRVKREIIESLSERLRDAERGQFTMYVQPLVVSLALMLDRADAYDGPGQGFVRSLRDETLDAMGLYGVEEVAAEGPVNPALHEIVEVEPSEGSEIEVVSLRRRGFHRDGKLIRAARVIARRIPARSPAEPA